MNEEKTTDKIGAGIARRLLINRIHVLLAEFPPQVWIGDFNQAYFLNRIGHLLPAIERVLTLNDGLYFQHFQKLESLSELGKDFLEASDFLERKERWKPDAETEIVKAVRAVMAQIHLTQSERINGDLPPFPNAEDPRQSKFAL